MTVARKLLIITNDFPPRKGGIQSMIFELTQRLPPAAVAVYCSNYAGAADFDRALDYPVVRHPTGLLIPTPAARRRILAVAKRFRSSTVWFGAAAPLALLAPALAKNGITRAVATTHGHEVGWARLPVARQALRRIGNHIDVATYLADYTRRRLEGPLGPHPELAQLTPGVDTATFSPQADGASIRRRYGLGERPVIVCVSRLVRRKGQDVLIQAMPTITHRLRESGAGDPVLLIVGEGPDRDRLTTMARRCGVSDAVILTGPVERAELPAHYGAGDVFAMPCRTRRFGMDVEGLGIVFLEASAVGLPVIAGDSGGAPDAVIDSQTGYVVDGRTVGVIAEQISTLLLDREARRAMGRLGREWVEQNWQWDAVAERLATLLRL